MAKRVDFDALWVEKYRPRSLKEMALPDRTRAFFQGILDTRDMPHLLLSGTVGTGKTTISRILIHELDAESLRLNASDERGIDTVRTRIKRFAQTVGQKDMKIVFLDEADNMTPDSQFAMRNLMEVYARKTRFLLTANHPAKLIDAIHSRCTHVQFRELGRKKVYKMLVRLLKAEHIKYEDDALLGLIDDFYPDVRSIINQMQRFSVGGTLNPEQQLGTYQNLIAAIKSKKRDFRKVREIIQDIPDYTGAMRYMERHADEFASPGKVLLVIADSMYRQAFMADREIGFAACCLKLMGLQ